VVIRQNLVLAQVSAVVSIGGTASTLRTRLTLGQAAPEPRLACESLWITSARNRTAIIQAKFYKPPVGNVAVQEVHAAKTHYGADQAWVVTNSRFTRSARELATTTDVRLLDGSTFRDVGLFISNFLGTGDSHGNACRGGTWKSNRKEAHVNRSRAGENR
jgi:Restriction endonuclease